MVAKDANKKRKEKCETHSRLHSEQYSDCEHNSSEMELKFWIISDKNFLEIRLYKKNCNIESKSYHRIYKL